MAGPSKGEFGHLHNEAVIDTSVNINCDVCTVWPTLALNVHGPQHERQLDEKHVVGDVAPNTDAPAKSEGDVAFLLSICRRRFDLARRYIEMPCGVEKMCIRTKGAGVTVDGPDVGDK